MEIDEKDESAVRLFPDMLHFYGTELQSHAAIIVGLGVLALGIVQTWGVVSATGGVTGFHIGLFSVLVGLVAAEAARQVSRVYVYGKLAGAIIQASDVGFNLNKEVHKKRYAEDPAIWGRLLDLTKVFVFTREQFELEAKYVNKLFSPGMQLRPWVRIVVFAASSVFSYSFVFGRFDWEVLVRLSLIWGAIGYVVLVLYGIGGFVRRAWGLSVKKADKLGHDRRN